MKKNQISIKVRLIIIKNGKLLTQFRKKDNYYHYIGGHLEYEETIKETALREAKEECGNDINFKFKKILYIRDFISSNEEGHSLELFVLGDINKYKALEKRLDPQHIDNSVWLTWIDIKHLPNNLFPKTLSNKLLKDFQEGFPKQGEYIGEVI